MLSQRRVFPTHLFVLQVSTQHFCSSQHWKKKNWEDSMVMLSFRKRLAILFTKASTWKTMCIALLDLKCTLGEGGHWQWQHPQMQKPHPMPCPDLTKWGSSKVGLTCLITTFVRHFSLPQNRTGSEQTGKNLLEMKLEHIFSMFHKSWKKKDCNPKHTYIEGNVLTSA